MKIYTYYDDINFNHQNELIKLWHFSWKQYGFDPIVLSRQDAISHPSYHQFVTEISELCAYITKQKLSEYGLACYLRWLAYANQSDDRVYFSDYDIINNGLYPEQLIDKLHMMDDCCPCFGSGSPKEFHKFCQLMINLTRDNKARLSNIKHRCFHDQDFMVHHRKDILSLDWIQLSRDRKKYCDFYQYGQTNHCKVIHFAHANIAKIKAEYLDTFNNVNDDLLRIILIKELLGII